MARIKENSDSTHQHLTGIIPVFQLEDADFMQKDATLVASKSYVGFNAGLVDEQRKKLGSDIKALRDARGVLQHQLGISPGAAGKLEKGEVVPKLGHFQKVMAALKLSDKEREDLLAQFRRAEAERDEHGPSKVQTGPSIAGELVTFTMEKSAALELMRALQVSIGGHRGFRAPTTKAAKAKPKGA